MTDFTRGIFATLLLMAVVALIALQCGGMTTVAQHGKVNSGDYAITVVVGWCIAMCSYSFSRLTK